jgi:peptidoglycan hydrolase CwlO-like protein
MEERIRNIEEFAQYATDMIVIMDEDQRAMRASLRRLRESVERLEESMQRTEESMQRLEENEARRDEVLQRMLQAVAVIQADIVRIDETRP